MDGVYYKSFWNLYFNYSSPTQPNGNIYVTPQLYFEDAVTDTENWTQLFDTYTAVGGEQYITIGNFFEPGNYDLVTINPGGQNVSYFYVENVSVELAAGSGTQYIDAEICPGECYEYDGEEYCTEGTFEIPAQGCFNLVNLTITYSETAIALIEDPDILDCNVNSIFLDASSSSSGSGVVYEWTGPNNFNSNEQNPEVFDPGNYTLVVSGSGLCSAEASVEVIEEIIIPDILAEVDGLIDCNNPIVTLTGSSTTPGVTFQWIGPGVNTNSPITATTQSGTYTLTVTTAAGCTNSEEIIVEEDLTLPDISAEVIGIIDCNNPTALLTGSSTTPNVTYVWSGPGLNTNDPITNTSIGGVYSFVVIGPNGCVSTVNVTVEEDLSFPDIEANSSGNLDCENSLVTLIGNSNTPNSTFQWIGPGVFEDGPQAETNQIGEYIFSATAPNGCISEISVIVTGNLTPPEIVIEPPNSLSCDDVIVELNASGSNGQGILSFEWQNENGDILGNNSTLDVSSPGFYTIIITDDENSCTANKCC